VVPDRQTKSRKIPTRPKNITALFRDRDHEQVLVSGQHAAAELMVMSWDCLTTVERIYRGNFLVATSMANVIQLAMEAMARGGGEEVRDKPCSACW